MGYADLGGNTGATYDYTLGQTIPFPGKLNARKSIRESELHLEQNSTHQIKLWVQHSATLAAIRWHQLNEVAKHSIERRRRCRTN